MFQLFIPLVFAYDQVRLGQYYKGSIDLPHITIWDDLTWIFSGKWREKHEEEAKKHWKYYSMGTNFKNQSMEVTDPMHNLAELRTFFEANVSRWQDLVIELIEDGEGFSDPNLYINLNGTKPTLTEYDLKCAFYGEDICVISGQELYEKNATNLTVGVFCKNTCKYKLQAELEAEVVLPAGEMHDIWFKKDQQRIFRFEVPNDTSIDTIQVRGLNQDKFAQFEMMVDKGNKVPDTEKALILYPAWENGYIGKFPKGNAAFCVGCNYTVMISAKHDGYINIGVLLSGTYTDLRRFKNGEMYDGIGKYSTQCYKYKVTDATKDFRVKLQAFGGNPDVFISPSRPIDHKNYTAAKYNSHDHFDNEEFVLDSKKRKEDGTSIGMFYLCVYGTEAGSYKLSVKNTDHSIWLQAGVSESGYIESQEIKQFYFTDKELMDPNIRIKYDAQVYSGAIKVKSKACRKSTNITQTCFMTPEEMMQYIPPKDIKVREGAQSETPDKFMCTPVSAGLRGHEAGCVYVIAVQGIRNQTNHYSLMVELKDEKTGKSHPTVLSEGMPSVHLLKEKEERYFQFVVDDRSIEKVTIQLTTIHGDPDMYVTNDGKTPSKNHYQTKSTKYGLYPDVVEFHKSFWNFNIRKTYKVMVTSWEETTFSLVFYTHSKDGSIGIQHLSVGKAQSGVMQALGNFSSSKLFEQTGHMYHFQVPSSLFKRKNAEVEVRVNAERGDFVYAVEAQRRPTQHDVDKKVQNLFMGGEYSDVIIRKEDLDSKLLKKRHVNFYVKVVPVRLNKTDTETFKYSIAFYDSKQLIHLKDSKLVRGVISNQSIDYYYFDRLNDNFDYEISLGSISGGNPNMVLSLNPDNQYPSRDNNDMSSSSLYTMDSMILTKDKIKEAKKNGHGRQAYLGIFTNDSESAIYSLVMSKKIDFNPIELKLGKAISGSLKYKQKRYYFTQAKTANGSSPILIDLNPWRGNPDMEITIISNPAATHTEWREMAKTPLLVSNASKGLDTMVLDPQTNQAFRTACGPECIILLAVKCSTWRGTSYRLQISQDFQELIDGAPPVRSQIHVARAHSHYRFFKFYKSCDLDCDLAIDVFPSGNKGKEINVLVNFENPHDLSAQTSSHLLPTWGNNPAWTVGVKSASRITIFSNEEWFQKHRVKVDDYELPVTSKGYYLIGIHSYSDVSFGIQAKTLRKLGVRKNETPLNIEKLFVGEVPKEFVVEAQKQQEFYFQNWREEKICFNLNIDKQSYRQDEAIEFKAGILMDGNEPYDGQGGHIPKSQEELNRRIKYSYEKAAKDRSVPFNWEICIPVNAPDYCVFCTYIVQIKNKKKLNGQGIKARIFVTQQVGDNQQANKLLRGKIHLGQPQPVKLEAQQQVELDIVTPYNLDHIFVEVEVLLGEAKIELVRTSDNKTLWQYGYPGAQSHYRDGNIIKFNITRQDVLPDHYRLGSAFKMLVTAVSEGFEAQIYARDNTTLELIPDGRFVDLSYVYEGKNKQESHYFLYAPSSREFELEINADMLHVDSDMGNYDTEDGTVVRDGVRTRDEGRKDGWRGIARKFFHIQISLKKLETQDDVKGQDVSWTDEFKRNEQFDYTINSLDQASGQSHLFAVKKFEADPSRDIILVKVTGRFNSQHDQGSKSAVIDYRVRMSASDVDILPVGSTIGGFVSDQPDKFKVYQLRINPMQFPATYSDGSLHTAKQVDLFLSLTPCAGLLKFYISDKYRNLFSEFSAQPGHHMDVDQTSLDLTGKDSRDGLTILHKKSKLRAFHLDNEYVRTTLDVYTDDFGIQGKRIKHIEKLKGDTIWIGVKTLNEMERAEELEKRAEEDEKKLQLSNEQKSLRRRHRSSKFAPLKGAFMSSEYNVSSFEISADFVETEKPDILDLYRLEDENFGIKIQNAGGHHHDRKVKFSWSPMQELDMNFKGIRYTTKKYNVNYKLFLGYSDATLDAFSSLCALQAKISRNRRLQACRFLQLDEVQEISDVKIFESFGQNHITVKDDGNVLSNLKAAVILAEVVDLKGRSVHLSYAPVWFFDQFNFDVNELHKKLAYIFATFFIICVCGFGVVAYFYKEKQTRNVQKQNTAPEISMQELPSASASEQSSMQTE